MWKWLAKRIFSDEMLDSLSERLLNRALDMVQSQEFIEKGLVPLTDQLYERYKGKLFSSIGGAMKGVSFTQQDQAQQNPLAMLSKSGKINWLQLAAAFFSRGRTEGQQPSSLP